MKLNIYVSSETESAKGEDAAKDETDEAAIEDGENGEIINNNTSATKAKSVTARVTSLLSAVKKSVGGRKEKYSEAGGEGGEVKLPVSIEIGLARYLHTWPGPYTNTKYYLHTW